MSQRNDPPGATCVEQIPAALRDRPQWVIWRREQRNGAKPTKVLYRPAAPTRKASSTDPTTWSDLESALQASTASDVDGIGYVFSPDDPFCGVDLDDCVTAAEMHPSAAGIVAELSSYAERSPSGTGVHVIVRATRGAGCRTERTPWGGSFEVYDRARYFTMTGDRLDTCPAAIEDRQAELDALHARMFAPEPERPRAARQSAPESDHELLDRMFAACNGAEVRALWGGDTSGHDGDDSRSDLALCSHLAFWTGGDGDRVDSMFRCSGLMRPKWDERRGSSTYGRITIDKALTGVGAFSSDNGGGREQSGDKSDRGLRERLSSTYLRSSTSALTFPKPLGDDAYCGLAGEVVKAIAPYTEADPAALLASLLAMFGNAVGRGPHFVAGDAQHHTNLFVCVVGETGEGRKGTSAEGPRRLIASADETWRRRTASGLVSGEGLIHHVRDPRSNRRKPRKGELPDADGLVEELVDAGVEDKRLLAMVPEFAQLLGAMGRKDNTLSPVLRDLWDRGDVQTLAKNSPERATGALVSVLAHITPSELRSRLESTEIANGFANRFIFVASRRSQLLSRGGSIPPGILVSLVPRLKDALEQARQLNEVDQTEECWQLWDQHYERLTTRPPGLVGAITGRAAPMVRRLALIYALMDERSSVHTQHLLAALELWSYVEKSARWVFGDRVGNQLADQCLALLRDAATDGISRTEIRAVLGNRIAASRIADALQLLEDAGLARKVMEQTGGRPTERWFIVEQGQGDEGVA